MYVDDSAFPIRREAVRWLICRWVMLTIVTAISAGFVVDRLALIGK